MFLYIPVEEQLTSPYVGAYRSFGIAVFRITAQRRQKLAFISDVSTDEAVTSLIACRCTREQLEPVHLRNVVEDFI